MEAHPTGQFATTIVNVQAGAVTYFKESTPPELRPQPLAFVQPLLLFAQLAFQASIVELA